MKKLYVVLPFVFVFVLFFIGIYLMCKSTEFNPLRVAHAGGGIAGKTYTNSYEALDENYKKGFRYFEIDFVFTSDNEVVCLHDWGHNFEKTFGFKTNKKITLKEFEKLASGSSGFENCTLGGLATWMTVNPLAYIITDVKSENLKALNIISKVLPNAKNRVVPQIYQPQNFNTIKDLGFEKIIWTLYKFRGDSGKVLEWVDKFSGPIAITMPRDRAESGLPKELAEKGIPTYVHTINSEKEMKKFIVTFGVSEVYTDFLVP